MKRWIVTPFIAASAVAQTQPVSDAEAALRKRVEEFLQLQQEQKFRQAEALVADESKDDYYISKKQSIENFRIARVDFWDGGKKAKVMVIAKTVLNLPGAGPRSYDVPSSFTWKEIDGKWYWYVDKELLKQTPFGQMKEIPKKGKAPDANPTTPFAGLVGSAPSMQALQNGVEFKPNLLLLEPGGESKSVSVKNTLPGVVVIEVQQRPSATVGLVISPEKLTLGAGESGEVKFKAEPGAKFLDYITLEVKPFNQTFVVSVKAASN